MKKCEYMDKHGHCMGQKGAPKCYFDLHETCKQYEPHYPNYINYDRNILIDLCNWVKQDVLYLKCLHKTGNFKINNKYKVSNVISDNLKNDIRLIITDPIDNNDTTISFFNSNFEICVE